MNEETFNLITLSRLLKNARFYSAVTLIGLALTLNSLPVRGQDMEEVGTVTICYKCTLDTGSGALNCVKIDCPK